MRGASSLEGALLILLVAVAVVAPVSVMSGKLNAELLEGGGTMGTILHDDIELPASTECPANDLLCENPPPTPVGPPLAEPQPVE